MGYYHGVRIRLFGCTYCERTCEPYTAYMKHFESKKNCADAVLEEAKDILERREAGELNEMDPSHLREVASNRTRSWDRS